MPPADQSTVSAQRPSRRRVQATAYAGLPVAAITLVCRWCARYVGVMPDYDYWGDLDQMLTPHGFHLTLHAVYALNNDHIVALPKLVFVANAFVTGGDNRVLTAITCLLSLAVAVLLTAALVRTVRTAMTDVSRVLMVAVGVVAGVGAFTPMAAHNYFFGMSGVTWVCANLAVLAAMYVLYRRPASYRALAFAIVLALLAAQCYSTGVPALLLIGIQSALRRETRWRGLAVTVAGMVAGVLYGSVSASVFPGKQVFSPRAVAEYAAAFLGSGLTVHVALAMVWGALAFLLFAWLVIRALARGFDLPPTQAFWTAVGGYAICAAGMAAVGRVGVFGLGGAVASRYATMPTLFWVALIGLLLAGRATQPAAAARVRVIATLALAGVGIVTAIVGSVPKIENLAARATGKNAAALSVYLGAKDLVLLHGAVTTATDQLTSIRQGLIAIGHVPFNGYFSRCPALGTTLARATSAGAATPRGFIDTAERLPDSGFIKVGGWAANGDDSSYNRLTGKPHCIAIANAAGVVQGLAVGGLRRPDVAAALKSDDLRFGWIGYVRASTIPVTLSAYALDRSNGRWYPLQHTLTLGPNSLAVH